MNISFEPGTETFPNKLWEQRWELWALIIIALLSVCSLALLALGIFGVYFPPITENHFTETLPSNIPNAEPIERFDSQAYQLVINGRLQVLAQYFLGSVGMFLLYFTWRRVAAFEKTNRIATETAKISALTADSAQQSNEIALQGQTVERFTRAVELLGGESIEERLGGIYALRKLSQEVDDYYWTIVEILTAYLRTNAPWPPKSTADPDKVADRDSEHLDQRYPNSHYEINYDRLDIRAVEDFLLNHRRPELEVVDGTLQIRSIDLRQTDLRNVEWQGIVLANARLQDACLQDAILQDAVLGGADLSDTILRGADLMDASLPRARLVRSDLQEARLWNAKMQYADFSRARLHRTELWDANLEWADLDGASLKGADIQRARLDSAFLAEAELTDITGWGDIKSIKEAWLGELKHSPPDFLEWALRPVEEGGGGAIEGADWHEWFKLRP